MRIQALFTFLLLFLATIAHAQQPIGWASAGGGTTGCTNGDTLVASTRDALIEAIMTRKSMVIVITDTLDMLNGEVIEVKGNDITFLGKGQGAFIRNGGLQLKGNNIVVRNISIGDSYRDGVWTGKGDPGTDGILIYGQNIWIDHCNFFHGYDGLLDMSKEADYITVSWCKFSRHNKVMLIGGTDRDSLISRNHLRATIHHCWFDGHTTFTDSVDKNEYRAEQRMPRVRFGDVHVFNNFYEEIGQYCVAAHIESDVVVENCYFRNLLVSFIVKDQGLGIEDPDLRYSGCVFDNVKHILESTGTAFNPADHYAYTLDSATTLPALIMNSAGIARNTTNHAPRCTNDAIKLKGTETIKIYPLVNDTDPDADSLRISAVLNTVQGKYLVFPDYIEYTPNKADKTIVYQVIDQQGGTSEATITLQ